MKEPEPQDKIVQEELKAAGNLPVHIAVIMDGNGRWAKTRGLHRLAGHHEGINSVRDIVEACGQLGVEALTLYTFSSENWRRPDWEVSALMKLLLRTIRKELNDLIENNVVVETIGKLQELPGRARREMEHAIDKTKGNTGLRLNLALSYGSRNEILDAVRAVCDMVKRGEVEPDEVDESLFTNFLYTKGLPDPDLLIRTSGEARISNFLLWQLAYTEIYITETLWPEFRREQLYTAIRDYQSRERRFGMVSEQLDEGADQPSASVL